MDYSKVNYFDNYVVLEGVKNFNIKQIAELFYTYLSMK